MTVVTGRACVFGKHPYVPGLVAKTSKLGYIMDYTVRLKRSVEKKLTRLPEKPKRRVLELIHVLAVYGPSGPKSWPNYGKLDEARFHCHLTGDHAWVACWSVEKEILTIEVYYAGSHQNAPY